MALDKEYFDSIHIEIVKKKYYNAHKVEAVFDDIRSQAEQLTEENKSMHDQLEALNSSKFEIGDAILTAQKVYKELIDKANARAKDIVAQAESEREQILNEAREQQDYAVSRVEHCYSRIKEQHMAAIEAINSEWQDFLCGLYPEDEGLGLPAVPAEHKKAAGRERAAEPELPEDRGEISQQDIEARVGAIARELFSDED